MGKIYVCFLFLILALCAIPEGKAADDTRFRLEVESGPVWQSRNDARIPNATGAKFSLRAVQGSGRFRGKASEAAGRDTRKFSGHRVAQKRSVQAGRRGPYTGQNHAFRSHHLAG